jgi:RNA polymerase-associated protein CTR9
VAPGNPEVLTLVGNLHLSLCDWAPAQSVFDQLLTQKVPNVDAYSQLSLGNIYFANLKTVPERYAKHLQYAADFYKRILAKDKANAYAANGIGTVLAERGELFKAKEAFNRVREVSGDTIADAHLNLGHIFLAQNKHPEALRMYQSYMKRTQDGTAPITTKSRDDDVVEVLLYIAFTYFDWARQAELNNDERAAPADERYRKCIEHLQLALAKSKKKDVIIQYNLCRTKLQAANCVLQKLTRNIRRTSQEVQDALDGLEESLPKVQEIMQWKLEKKKIPISTTLLQDFITHCKSNIESAKSHLEEEKRREKEAQDILDAQKETAETKLQEEAARLELLKAEEEERQAERDRKVRLVDRLFNLSRLRDSHAIPG